MSFTKRSIFSARARRFFSSSPSFEAQDPDQEQTAQTGSWKGGTGTLLEGRTCHWRFGRGKGRSESKFRIKFNLI